MTEKNLLHFPTESTPPTITVAPTVDKKPTGQPENAERILYDYCQGMLEIVRDWRELRAQRRYCK